MDQKALEFDPEDNSVVTTSSEPLPPEFSKLVDSSDQQNLAPCPVDVADAINQDCAILGSELDECDLGELSDKEPTTYVLDKWDRNAGFRDILSLFIMEERVGGATIITIQEVLLLFEAMSIALADFVSKFKSGVDEKYTDVIASNIIKKFSSVQKDGKDALRFRDLYRLLEIIGWNLRKFLRKLSSDPWCEPEDFAQESGPRLGDFRILREIGSGFGAVVYMAEHIKDRKKVALKHPVKKEELVVLREIHRNDLLGVTQLLVEGRHEGQPYVVTDLLGSPLTKLFQRIRKQSLDKRWHAVCVVGRMMVRRLQGIHSCGFVHCDVSPENILLGPAKGDEPTVTPYLVDFGLARKYPGGGRLAGEHGSVEWSSIRSADGEERRPLDDLEALGWPLVSGLFGELPWFKWLRRHMETGIARLCGTKRSSK